MQWSKTEQAEFDRLMTMSREKIAALPTLIDDIRATVEAYTATMRTLEPMAQTEIEHLIFGIDCDLNAILSKHAEARKKLDDVKTLVRLEGK